MKILLSLRWSYTQKKSILSEIYEIAKVGEILEIIENFNFKAVFLNLSKWLDY